MMKWSNIQGVVQKLLIVQLFFLLGCQQEERVIVTPPEDAIEKNSELAITMKRVVTHDGSYDDIVDKGNCYSIDLPYDIVRNGELYTIESAADYNTILPDDDIQISFPITVTTHQHQQVLVTSNSALDILSSTCTVNDDDIECIDFSYPIKIAVFNNETNEMSVEVIEHDSRFYNFMENLEEHTLISITYPIELLRYDSNILDATHNEELLQEITQVIDACDEMDEL